MTIFIKQLGGCERRPPAWTVDFLSSFHYCNHRSASLFLIHGTMLSFLSADPHRGSHYGHSLRSPVLLVSAQRNISCAPLWS
jgi:hypothetical protein